MRLRFAVPLVVAVPAVGLGVIAPTSGSASCVAPSIELVTTPTFVRPISPGRSSPARAHLTPGARFAIEGRAFVEGCNDTAGVRTGGCSAPQQQQRRAEAPSRAVPLTLTQNGRSWTLGTADAAGAAEQYAARWTVQLPVDVVPGDATLTSCGASLPVEITSR